MFKYIFISFFLMGTLFTSIPVFAAEASNAGLFPDFLLFNCVPGEGVGSQQPGVTNLGQCIKGIYEFGVGAVAILAVAVIIWGGFTWMTSGGNVSRIESAKEWIYGAVFGLILALTSFLLLSTINPQLVTISLSIPSPQAIENLTVDQVCCFIEDDETSSTHFVSKGLAGNDCQGLAVGDQTARLCTTDEENRLLGKNIGDRCGGANGTCNPLKCYENSSGQIFKLDCINPPGGTSHANLRNCIANVPVSNPNASCPQGTEPF